MFPLEPGSVRTPRRQGPDSPALSLGPLSPRMAQAHPLPHMGLFVHCLQGIKKPYNPVLGETFRCCWFHPQTHSHTFYLAEQARARPGLLAGLCGGRPAVGTGVSPQCMFLLRGPTFAHQRCSHPGSCQPGSSPEVQTQHRG